MNFVEELSARSLGGKVCGCVCQGEMEEPPRFFITTEGIKFNDTPTWSEIIAANHGYCFQKRMVYQSNPLAGIASNILIRNVSLHVSQIHLRRIFNVLSSWHFWRTLWGLRVRNIFGLLKVRKVLVPGVPGVVNKSGGPQMAAHKRANKGGRDAYVRYGWTCGFVACAFAFNMFWHMWNCGVEPVMHRFLWNQSMHTSNRFWQIANGFTYC